MPAGRPSTYTPEIGDLICQMMAEGQSITKITQSDDKFPHISTVYEWRRLHPEFAEKYMRAREDQSLRMAEQLLDIADDESIPADSRRIRVDARKWLTCKYFPKVFGDKVQQEVSGPEGGPVKLGIIELIPLKRE